MQVRGEGTIALPLQAEPELRRQRAWSALRRQKLAMVGVVIVGFFLVIAVIGPKIAPYDPLKQTIRERFAPPSQAHWLGQDEFGRDILSRLLHGAWISFEVGVISVALAGIFGVVLGLVAGYWGGWLDTTLTLMMDVLNVFPSLLLAISLVAVLGNSLRNVFIAIAVTSIPAFMRIVRGSVLSVRQTPYIEAATSVGVPTGRILARHIFPNVTPPLIVHSSLTFAYAVLAEASLAYLGLGNRPPAPSWGSMLNSSYGFLETAPWVSIFPGVAIALTVLGFNLLGDGIRDALDPRLR
ncbi:MAG: ABC transporter permease [Chloroflexota bacterium]|nr:ABC transporter permease [Chloroflexota bacterium]